MTARKMNWGVEETDVLVEEVTGRWSVLKGKFSPSLTLERKNKAWEEIAKGVNAVNTSGVVRDVKNIKKKWSDLQSLTRKKEAERRRESSKTGGGPAPLPLKAWEEKIISVMADGVISGVDGGFDSSSSASTTHSTVPIATVALSSRPAIDALEDETIEGNEAPSCYEVASTQSPSSSCCDLTFTASSAKKSKQAFVKTNTPINYNAELLEIEKEKLELEKRKVVALEGIWEELRRKSPACVEDLFVSPIVKFN